MGETSEIADGNNASDAFHTDNLEQVLPCKVCGTTRDTARCSRCLAVAYCGKEHQKKDWRMHKKLCVENLDRKSSQAKATSSSSQNAPKVGETARDEPETTLDEDVDADISITSSGVFNMAGPGEPPRYVELSKEQVLAQLMGGGYPQ